MRGVSGRSEKGARSLSKKQAPTNRIWAAVWNRDWGDRTVFAFPCNAFVIWSAERRRQWGLRPDARAILILDTQQPPDAPNVVCAPIDDRTSCRYGHVTPPFDALSPTDRPVVGQVLRGEVPRRYACSDAAVGVGAVLSGAPVAIPLAAFLRSGNHGLELRSRSWMQCDVPQQHFSLEKPSRRVVLSHTTSRIPAAANMFGPIHAVPNAKIRGNERDPHGIARPDLARVHRS